MSNTNSIVIGYIPTNRGQYNQTSTYFEGNIVTYYGSQFSARTNNFSNIPPLSLSDDGTVYLANESYWKVITDNVALYNASLSKKNLSNRVETLEKNMDSAVSKSSSAFLTASAASDDVEKLNGKVTTLEKNIISAGDKIKENSNAISSNERAIKALQLGASPLTVECELSNGFEFNFVDSQVSFQVSIPFKILDGSNDITESSTTSATITNPNGDLTKLSGNLTSLDFGATIPGKYSLAIKSTNDGRAANASYDFYVKAPVKMASVVDGNAVVRSFMYINDFPARFTFSSDDDYVDTLRFYIPKYLSNSPSLSCEGITVPTTLSDGNIYWQLDYVGGIKNGTYKFTINK